MRVMEINGIPCPKSLLVATNLMRAAEGDVQLIATQEEEENEEEVPLLFYSTYWAMRRGVELGTTHFDR